MLTKSKPIIPKQRNKNLITYKTNQSNVNHHKKTKIPS